MPKLINNNDFAKDSKTRFANFQTFKHLPDYLL